MNHLVRKIEEKQVIKKYNIFEDKQKVITFYVYGQTKREQVD